LPDNQLCSSCSSKLHEDLWNWQFDGKEEEKQWIALEITLGSSCFDKDLAREPLNRNQKVCTQASSDVSVVATCPSGYLLLA
jgi:hypothetical protein